MSTFYRVSSLAAAAPLFCVPILSSCSSSRCLSHGRHDKADSLRASCIYLCYSKSRRRRRPKRPLALLVIKEEEAFLLRQKGKEEGFVEAAADVLTTIRLYIIEALKNNIVATVLAIPTGWTSFAEMAHCIKDGKSAGRNKLKSFFTEFQLEIEKNSNRIFNV